MPLQKQIVPINLAQGLDQANDERYQMPGRLTRIENAVYTKHGRLDKRFGSELLPTVDIDGNTITGKLALTTYRDELLLYNGKKLYGFSETADAWIDKGDCLSTIVKTQSISAYQVDHEYVDSISIGNYTFFMYQTGEAFNNRVRVTIWDDLTNTALLSDYDIGPFIQSRIDAAGGFVYLTYTNSNKLNCIKWDSAAPTTFPSAVALATDIVSGTNLTCRWDVAHLDDTHLFLVYNSTTASTIKLKKFDLDLTQVGSTDTISATLQRCLVCFFDASDNLFIFWYDTTNAELKGAIADSDAVVQVTGILVADPNSATSIYNITGHPNGASGVTVLYSVEYGSSYYSTMAVDVADDGTEGTPSTFKGGLTLHSRPFLYTQDDNTSNYYFVFAYVSPSNVQNCYFVVRDDGYVIARCLYEFGGGLPESGDKQFICNATEMSSGKFVFAALRANRFTTEGSGSGVEYERGMSRVTIDFNNPDIFATEEINDTLYIAGGNLQMYDGQNVVEAGFFVYPEEPSVTTSGSGGSLSAGDYQYLAIYEWKDSNGKLFRSAASPIITVTNVLNGSNTVNVRYLTLTRKDGSNAPRAVVAIYRTEANGTIFYRRSSILDPNYTDVTDDILQITDGLSDADLIDGEILYTTGGEIENKSPPPATVLRAFKNRLFLGGLEEGGELRYSKKAVSGLALEFASEFSVKLVEPLEDETLGVIDDKLIIMRKDKLYFTYGDGPNSLGQGGSFADPEFLTSDVGCTQSKSLVRTPRGLMFMTGKGIHLLDSQLQLSYVGHDIEDFNDSNIEGAVLLPNDNQVRFVTVEGNTLVYEYNKGLWSIFTGQAAEGAAIWDDAFILLKSDGDVLKENKTLYKDDTTSYAMLLETGWLQLAGIGGFQRIYRLLFKGQYKSNHQLKLSVAYDGLDTYVDSVTISPAAYSVTGDYRVLFHLARQKCEAVRFKIEEVIADGTSGTHQSLTVQDIAIQVGVKPGLYKFNRTQSAGAT